MEQLKQCPWCQKKAKLQTRRTDRRSYKYARYRSQAVCGACHARGPLRETEEAAVSAWNSRPSNSIEAVRAELQLVKEELAESEACHARTIERRTDDRLSAVQAEFSDAKAQAVELLKRKGSCRVKGCSNNTVVPYTAKNSRECNFPTLLLCEKHREEFGVIYQTFDQSQSCEFAVRQFAHSKQFEGDIEVALAKVRFDLSLGKSAVQELQSVVEDVSKRLSLLTQVQNSGGAYGKSNS